MHGPTREHVDTDAYQDDPRVVMPFNGMSPSGDVEADVVYANYGTPEDFEKLEKLNIDVRGKIVLVRYGQNFRGVKVFIAQERGAAGVIIYSDPADDGWRRGDKYPDGPWRPDTGVQRGSVGFMFEFPGDPTTPGVASLSSLPDITADFSAAVRADAEDSCYTDLLSRCVADPATSRRRANAPRVARIVAIHLPRRSGTGAIEDAPQAGLPVPHAVGCHRVASKAASLPDQWVIAGNHRDAWAYGAVDPNSGTAAMLESVHGVGELLKSGWKPKRTLVFCSWDGEEEGLMGSTEWVEQHEADLRNAVGYFNVDVAVSGSKFGASAVPSLKQFVRDITKVVPSPKGGTVYDVWQKSTQPDAPATQSPTEAIGDSRRTPAAQAKGDIPVGDLGSGSDYTAFLQHVGVPSTDVSSSGPYGVYHSVFDNFDVVQEVRRSGLSVRAGDGTHSWT